MPSKVAEELVMEAVPLPTTGRSELPTSLMAPTPAGATQPDEAPLRQAEVVVAVIGGPQPNTTVVEPEAVVQPAPPAAQMTVLDMGRTEGDTAKGSSGVVVVVERTNEGLPLALALGGSHSPTQGKPLLQWIDLQDPTSTLYSLDDATESIEWDSLNEGISAMLEALNQARGTLHDVIIPTGWVFT